MIVAVLATNVLVAGFYGLTKPASSPGALIRRWQENAFTLVLSEPILSEFARVIDRPFFTGRLTTSEIEAALTALRTLARIQQLTVPVTGAALHAEDDLILATAASAQADFLVTGDKALLELRPFQSSLLLSPRQFLEVLDRSQTVA